jgi:hypothetical protein
LKTAHEASKSIRYKSRIGYQLVAAFYGVNVKFFSKSQEFTKDHQPQPNMRIELSDIVQTVH